MDLFALVGRLHPLLVHLPIGILLLAVLFDVVRRRNDNLVSEQAVRLTLFLGAISATITAGAGWVLAESGGYDPDLLGPHRWLGVLVAAFAWLTWFVVSGSTRWYTASLVGLALVTIGAGHYGGTLTHGSDYLTETMPFLFGDGETSPTGLAEADPAEIGVYESLIAPLLSDRCVRCHGAEKQDGDLDLSKASMLFSGGESGAAVVAGSALSSEMFERVSRDPGRKGFMPETGRPLTFKEVRLLQWWIDQGADTTATVVDIETPEDVQSMLLASYGLDVRPKRYVETLQVDSLSPDIVGSMEAAGFDVQFLAEFNFLVDVAHRGETLDLAPLRQASEQIVWLDLGGSGVSDDDLAVVGELPNLVRLRLDRTEITGAGLRHLEPLLHLESLNLYGTNVDDEAVDRILALPALRKVFLWQTRMSPEGIQRLRDARRSLEVDAGVDIEPATTDAS